MKFGGSHGDADSRGIILSALSLQFDALIYVLNRFTLFSFSLIQNASVSLKEQTQRLPQLTGLFAVSEESRFIS